MKLIGKVCSFHNPEGASTTFDLTGKVLVQPSDSSQLVMTYMGSVQDISSIFICNYISVAFICISFSLAISSHCITLSNPAQQIGYGAGVYAVIEEGGKVNVSDYLFTNCSSKRGAGLYQQLIDVHTMMQSIMQSL